MRPDGSIQLKDDSNFSIKPEPQNNTFPANIADIIPPAAPSADQIAPKPEGDNT